MGVDPCKITPVSSVAQYSKENKTEKSFSPLGYAKYDKIGVWYHYLQYGSSVWREGYSSYAREVRGCAGAVAIPDLSIGCLKFAKDDLIVIDWYCQKLCAFGASLQLCSASMTTTGIEHACVCVLYLRLLWLVWQSRGALEHDAIILYLGLHTNGRFNPIR